MSLAPAEPPTLGPVRRGLAQARALVGLRWTLWWRNLRGPGGGLRLALTLFSLALGLLMVAGLTWGAHAFTQLPRRRAVPLDPLALFGLGLALLFGVRLYVAVLGSAQSGPLLEPRRFVVYSVHPALISAINLVAQLFEPGWLMLYPPLVALALGFGRWPGAPGAPLLLLGSALAFLLAATFLQLLSGLLGELTARSKLRGILPLLAMGGWFALSRNVEQMLGGRRGLSPTLVSAIFHSPAGWAVEFASGAAEGNLARAAHALALLLAGSVLCGVLAHRLALREASRPEETVRAGAPRAGSAGWALPLVSGPVSAVLEKEVKTLLRAGWVQLLIAPALLAMVRGWTGSTWAMQGTGALLAIAGYAHLGVVGYVLNLFGWDADAARAWLLWPVRGRVVIGAKLLVAYLFSLLLFLAMTGLHLLQARLTSEELLIGLLAHAASFPVLMAVGIPASLLWPIPLRGGRQRRQGASGMTLVVRLLALPLFALACGLPAFLAHLTGRPAIVLYLAELLVMGAVAFGFLASAERLLLRGRERLLQALARQE